MHTVRPRQHAAYIASLSSKEARNKALQAVPEDYREMVKTHVTNFFALRKRY